MVFLAVLLAGYVILTVFLLAHASKSMAFDKKIAERCPPHKWTLRIMPELDDKTYYMVCKKCNKLPNAEDNEF